MKRLAFIGLLVLAGILVGWQGGDAVSKTLHPTIQHVADLQP